MFKAPETIARSMQLAREFSCRVSREEGVDVSRSTITKAESALALLFDRTLADLAEYLSHSLALPLGQEEQKLRVQILASLDAWKCVPAPTPRRRRKGEEPEEELPSIAGYRHPKTAVASASGIVAKTVRRLNGRAGVPISNF